MCTCRWVALFPLEVAWHLSAQLFLRGADTYIMGDTIASIRDTLAASDSFGVWVAAQAPVCERACQEQLLDPNADGETNRTDLIWHNGRLPTGKRLTWPALQQLHAHYAPDELPLTDAVDVARLRGTIILIKNNHGNKDGLAAYERAPDTSENRAFYESRLKPVGECQTWILRTLEQEQAQHLFAESQVRESAVQPDGRIWIRERDAQYVVAARMGPLLETFGARALIHYGAALVYTAMHPGVVMHPVISAAQYRDWTLQYDQAVQQLRAGTWTVAQFAQAEAQISLIPEAPLQHSVETFLAEQPGATVHVIFGALHDFSDNFAYAELHPTLTYAERRHTPCLPPWWDK